MIEQITRFFETNVAKTQTDASDEHAQQLAMAALMLEVAASDYKQQPEEKAVLVEQIRQSFGLNEKEADELIALATREHDESTDYFQFTRLINQTFSEAKKIELIENLWRVAYADQKLHRYEEHVIRRIADLIYVSHKDFIASKHRAKQSSQTV